MNDGPDERLEKALDLLASAAEDELTVKQAVKRLESISASPRFIRTALEKAEMRGIIDRDADRVFIQESSRGIESLESNIVTKEGEFKCQRCDRRLTTGYFIVFEHRQHGPFGSTCIRHVTGREAEE